MILVALAAYLSAPLVAATTTVVTVQRMTVVRVPARRRVAAPPLVTYREKKGPHCIYSTDVSAAAVTDPTAVDFALKGGDRVRAHLEDECPALDFYRGFYLSPSADGKICAGRDVIRTRSGGECGIDRFRKLVPQPSPPPG